MTCPSPHRVEVPPGLESLGLTSTAAARSSCGGAMALVGLPANRGRRDQPRWRWRRDEAHGNPGRRRREGRRAGHVPGDVCRAVRLIVIVVASLARLLD